jgi:hypothetical protein
MQLFAQGTLSCSASFSTGYSKKDNLQTGKLVFVIGNLFRQNRSQ